MSTNTETVNVYGARGGHCATTTAAALAIIAEGALSTTDPVGVLPGHPNRRFVDAGTVTDAETIPAGSVIVVRGPDYNGLRTIQANTWKAEAAPVLLVITEEGRPLRTIDAAGATGLQVFEMPWDSKVARAVDAGLPSRYVNDGNRQVLSDVLGALR